MSINIALQPKQSDVEAFQAGLLMLAKDLITNKSIKIRMFAGFTPRMPCTLTPLTTDFYCTPSIHCLILL